MNGTRSRALLALVALLVITVAPAALAEGHDRGSGWFPTRKVSHTAAPSQTPVVAATADHVHVAWRDGTGGTSQITYRRSVDYAATWQQAVWLTSTAATSRRPAIAAEDTTVHLVWDESAAASSVWYRRSPNGGYSWRDARRLSPARHDATRADVAVAGDRVHVVWEDGAGGTANVWYRRSINGGVNWSQPVRLTHDVGHARAPAIAAYGDVVHLVWSDTRAGGNEVYYRRSDDGGATWSTPARRLSFKPGASWEPDVAVRCGSVHVVWSDEAAGWDVFHKRSLDAGLTWDPARNLSRSAGAARAPALACSSTGLDVVWSDDASGAEQIHYRRSVDQGAVWGPNTMVTSTAGASLLPAIAMWQWSTHMVWQDDVTGQPEIYHKRRG